MTSPVERARRLADDVLFPKANEVDQSGRLPIDQLNQIADQGLYGLVGSAELGGVGVEPSAMLEIIESLASGCLTTCFVWLQHQNAVGLAARSTGDFHDRWAAPLAQGLKKAGVAFAHLLRTEVIISARQADPDDPSQGWILNGTAPWVTGWGYIDIVSTAARVNVGYDNNGEITEPGDVLWLFVDATETTAVGSTRLNASQPPSLQTQPLELSAVNSSATCAVEFTNLHVPADRLANIEPYMQWRSNYAKGLRVNASLALGICRRCLELLDNTGISHTFASELKAVRGQVDQATEHEMPAARANLSTLAVRMSAALVAATGGRSVMSDQSGQRLAREAIFLLIQGQTAEIKRHQVAGLGGSNNK